MKKSDGRKPNEMRHVTIKAGVVPNANGSAMVQMGKTIAIAAVYGPKEMIPKHKKLSDRAVLETVYTLVPFSTTDRARPGPSRRSKEISMVTRQALEPAIFLEEFPKTRISVFIDIVQADAGTRTAGINAASVALADAGIPMRDLVTSIAVGKVGKEIVMDLDMYGEEATDCDLPIAFMPREKKITLLQMDGDMSAKDLKDGIKLAIEGCKELYKKQKDALKDRWVKG